jgi:thiol:disulfide interchange protein DsbD
MSGLQFQRFTVKARQLALGPALFLLALLGLLAAPASFAIGEDEYLQPEQAFQYTATADENTLTIEWKAARGYYLYKKRMGLAAATSGVTVGTPVYPKGESHKDEFFGEQEVFRNEFKVTAPLKGARAGDTIAIKIQWQGCADAGLCYPPSVWDANVKVAGDAPSTDTPAVIGEEEYLPVDQAFALTADALTVNNLQLNWRIADGYYLYKERIKIEPTGATTTIGALVLPKGENHHDEYFGDQEVYRQSVDATFSVPPPRRRRWK